MKTSPLTTGPLATNQVNRDVFVVSVSATSTDTGSLVSQRLIGITEDQRTAEALTEQFNAREIPAEGVEYKAFYLRYTLPYFSPLAKQILEVEKNR